MKKSLFAGLLILSVLFLSCSGASQNSEGSITLDAGKVARYLGKNVSNSRIARSANARSSISHMNSNFPDINNYLNYEMSIKVSTIGKYETSAESNYKKSLPEVLAAGDIEATLESFYKEAAGKPLTLEGIPVGSKIKVKVELSFGEILDVDAYKQVFSAEVQNWVSQELAAIQSEFDSERFTVEATSDTFTVKSGENTITIQLNSPDGFVTPVNILLFSNVSSLSNNALYSYPMSFNADSFSTNAGKKIADFGENTLLDFASDSQGNTYYITSDPDNDSHVLYYSGADGTWNEEIVDNSSHVSGRTRIAIDEKSGEVFFGSTWENYFYVNTLPKYADNDLFDDDSNDFSLDGIDEHYEEALDFAVSLGSPVITTSGASRILTYNDAAVYVAVSKSIDTGMNGPFERDIIFIKKPMIYKVTQTAGLEKTVYIKLSQSTPEIIYLSDTVPENFFLYNEYYGVPLFITDMIIHNGNLYALLSLTDNSGPYDESLKDVYNYSLYSYGGLVKINLSDFSNTGLSVIGYSQSNIKNFESVPASNSTMIQFTAYQPAGVNASYFFGPQKFVAIKPKELVIADDGYFYYTDGSDFCYKNVDRLVVFNEDTNQLKAYLLDSSNLIKFNNHSTSDVELEVLASGYQSNNPEIKTQCKYRP